MDWSARCLFHARTAVTTLVPLERGHGGISRICGGVQFLEEDEAKVKRVRMWLKHADLGSRCLERSPFCVCWPKCGVELAAHGRSNRASNNSLPALWQRMEDLTRLDMLFGWNTNLS